MGVNVILNGNDDPPSGALSPSEQRELRASLDILQEAPFIPTAGRLIHQKGHTFLLVVVPDVLAEFPNATFVLAGDGIFEENLVRKASDMGIGHAVRFLGHWLDAWQRMSSADLFILPSLWEGLPLALLEARWLGFPVVATKVEGVVEVVQDEVSGLLVPASNPHALAAALNLLLGGPGKAGWLGKKADRVVKARFTAERMFREYERLFQESASPA